MTDENVHNVWRKIVTFFMIVFGMSLCLYAGYVWWHTGDILPYLAMLAGFFMAFNMADRNVYKNRLDTLRKSIEERDDVEVAADGWEKYKLVDSEENE